MTALEMTLICMMVIFAALSVMAVGAAYRNGVTDGYGYSKEPTCPGYRHAGAYLKANMSHRWPELRRPPSGHSSNHRNSVK